MKVLVDFSNNWPTGSVGTFRLEGVEDSCSFRSINQSKIKFLLSQVIKVHVLPNTFCSYGGTLLEFLETKQHLTVL
jgi:hypothetical protein